MTLRDSFMPRLVVLIASCALALGACGDDDPDDNGNDVIGGVDTGGPVVAGVSQLTGVDTRVNVTPPAAADCDQSTFIDGIHGAQYPWGGATIAGQTYTCNGCPGGHPEVQGMYRVMGFDDDGTANPDLPDADNDYAELLYIDGNTWYSVIRDARAGTTTETRGWFFCAMKPEHPNAHTFWTTTAVDQGSAQVGGVNESDVFLTLGGGAEMLLFWTNEPGTSLGIELGYCRIGSTVGGKLCQSPF